MSIDKYDGDYTYKKKDITLDKKSNKYPIVERTYNAEMFPWSINNKVDFEQEKN